MTAQITIPAGPRIAGDGTRINARAREGSEADGFTCILESCETKEDVALDDTGEDGDHSAQVNPTTDNSVRIEMASPLFAIQAQAAPPQTAPAPQPGKLTSPAISTLLASTALPGLNADTADEQQQDADIQVPKRAEPGDESLGLRAKDAVGPKLAVVASLERHGIFSDNRPKELEGAKAQRDEPAIFAPTAGSPDQGTSPPPSPAAQILTRIADFATPAEQPADVAQAITPGSSSTPNLPQGMAVRTLRIRLEPESLGEVDVTLRQTANGVKVEIQVAQRATAETLSRDLSLLEDKLAGLLGTSAATAAVSISLQSGSPADMRPASGSSQSFTQAWTGSGAPGGGSAGHREPRPEGHEAPFKLNRTGTDEEDSAIRGFARTGRVV